MNQFQNFILFASTVFPLPPSRPAWSLMLSGSIVILDISRHNARFIGCRYNPIHSLYRSSHDECLQISAGHNFNKLTWHQLAGRLAARASGSGSGAEARVASPRLSHVHQVD